MGGGQRSRIELNPHSGTLGFVPRGDLRHFVVEGIQKSRMRQMTWAWTDFGTALSFI